MEERTIMEKLDEKILVLDLETTGFLGEGFIVEIGMVLTDLKTGKMVKVFDKIVSHPEIKKSPESFEYSWIFQNSTLTLDEVLKAEDLDVYRKEIQSLLDKYPVTAFNKEFDIGYLRDFKFNVPNEKPCIMKELTPIMKLHHHYYGVKWPKVEEAWKFFFPDTEYTELHRAYDDAIHEAQILLKMVEKLTNIFLLK